MNKQTDNRDWEEEFDEKFCILMYGPDIDGYKNIGILNDTASERLKMMHPTKPKPIPPTADDIKSFISSLLLSERNNLIDKIHQIEQKYHDTKYHNDAEKALIEVINLIKENGTSNS